MQVIARIIRPVRESVKTEAEVAAMKLVRGHYLTMMRDVTTGHLSQKVGLTGSQVRSHLARGLRTWANATCAPSQLAEVHVVALSRT